jgi:hypothetical protein
MEAMMAAEQAIERDGRGRFQPGCSGNPRGKPPGALNQATRLKALLEDGEERANARVVIDRALGGNLVAARILMDRLDPKPRTRPIPLELGPDAEIDPAYEAAFHRMVEGDIAPEEALAVARFLEQLRDSRANSAEAAAQAKARDGVIVELQRQNDALRAELAALKSEVAALRTAPAARETDARPASPVEPTRDVTAARAEPGVEEAGAGATVPAPGAAVNSTCIFRPGPGSDSGAPAIPAVSTRRRQRAKHDWPGQPARVERDAQAA